MNGCDIFKLFKDYLKIVQTIQDYIENSINVFMFSHFKQLSNFVNGV